MAKWQNFEDLVAAIHQALDGQYFTVEQDVTLREPTGATHQIDVVVRPRSAFVPPILVSCKSSKEPVGPVHVREWSDIVHGTGSAAGVIVSPVGFTRDAIDVAKATWRRVSLWIPRTLDDGDFAPDEKSPAGYVRSVHFTMRCIVPRAVEKTFRLEVESVTGKPEGREIEFTFSAATRDRYYLRDKKDAVVENLWDEYTMRAGRANESGPLHIAFEQPRFLVFDGHRVRFKFLEMFVEVGEFTLPFEIDMTKSAFAYENAVTCEVRTVPLPASMLNV